MITCTNCGPSSPDAPLARAAGIDLEPGQRWRAPYWSDGKGQTVRCGTCEGSGEIDDLEEESRQRDHDEWIDLGRDE